MTVHEKIQYRQAWSFHFFNKVMTKLSAFFGHGTWISVKMEVLLEDQRNCYHIYTQCNSVLMLLESNIVVQMDLQWICLVNIQRNVTVGQYLIWQVGKVIRSSGKLAGFIQVSTLYISVTSGHSSPGGGMALLQLLKNRPKATDPTTFGGCIEVQNCLIRCSSAMEPSENSFVPPLFTELEKSAYTLFSKSTFSNKNHLNLSHFFLFKENFEKWCLILEFFDSFKFWNVLFSKMSPNFWPQIWKSVKMNMMLVWNVDMKSNWNRGSEANNNLVGIMCKIGTPALTGLELNR